MGGEELVLQGHLLVIIGLLQKKRFLLLRKAYRKKKVWMREILQKRKSLGHNHTWYRNSDFMTASTFLGKSVVTCGWKS